MTTTEIQALVDGVKSFGRYLASDVPYLIDAIETLLARDNIRTFAEQETRIAELERERDELQRRLDAVVAMWDMNTKPRPKHEDFHPFDYEQWNDAVCAWDRNASRYARALAIAEGRDNG